MSKDIYNKRSKKPYVQHICKKCDCIYLDIDKNNVENTPSRRGLCGNCKEKKDD